MTNVLLVEDDPFIADIYETKIRNEGFNVAVASDGEEGIYMYAKLKPDVVLLDIVLPAKNGWEVLRSMKQHGYDSKILVLSNLDKKDEVDKAANMGAARYLIKAHYTPGEVVDEIKKELEKANA